jgi:hypothetical protein
MLRALSQYIAVGVAGLAGYLFTLLLVEQGWISSANIFLMSMVIGFVPVLVAWHLTGRLYDRAAALFESITDAPTVSKGTYSFVSLPTSHYSALTIHNLDLIAASLAQTYSTYSSLRIDDLRRELLELEILVDAYRTASVRGSSNVEPFVIDKDVAAGVVELNVPTGNWFDIQTKIDGPVHIH